MDLNDVVAVVGEQFPELRPVEATYLGEGYDSVAFEVAPKWVFRFPKRADVEAQLLLELRVLPLLSGSAPLPIPEYRFRGTPSDRCPRHFAGYEKLPGVQAIGSDPLTHAERSGPVLGGFLSWLHAFPINEAERAGVPRLDGCALIEESRREALADFDVVRSAAPDQPLETWLATLDRAPLDSPSREEVLLHADFAAEHVLWLPEEGRPSGVIDWSEISIGDPAVDLAGLYHWGGPAFAGRILAHYVPVLDADVLERARYLALCRGVADVVYGTETGRREYIDGGIRALVLNGKEV